MSHEIITFWDICYLEGRLLGHILELFRTRRTRLENPLFQEWVLDDLTHSKDTHIETNLPY